MPPDPSIRWSELVGDLAKLTSASAVANRIGVKDREIRRWKRGEARPQGDSAERLLRECEERGINWRNYQRLVPVYDYRNTYEANLRDGPQGMSANHNPFLMPARTRFLGHDLNSPIGLPASPLTANADWISLFARYGYDILTAKTVRTKSKKAHPFPNWVHLPGLTTAVPLGGFPASVLGQLDLPENVPLAVSTANSFGMPSPTPEVWISDLERAKSMLLPGQILIASVVGTADEPGEDLISDFVECGKRAAEAKPHAIEVNLSCPNVYGKEGSLCANPEAAGETCRRLADAVRPIPVLVKICYLPMAALRLLFLATYKYVNGFTAINTIPASILADGQTSEALFPGGKRSTGGVSGLAIRDHATQMARDVMRLTHEYRKDLENIGVGGITSAQDVVERLGTGMSLVQLCTVVNLNPLIGQQIRKQLVAPASHYAEARFEGEVVTFSDANVKAAYKITSEVCKELGVPFDVGIDAVRQNWLDRYQRERRRLHAGKNAARGKAPDKTEIDAWIRYAVSPNKRR
jgi:dihydroorotate dehydrogenase (NAD+) catalytic subunit